MGTERPLFMGQLARQVGVNRETLRYYERRGLLKPRRRTPSGYRLYDADDAERLRFIKTAQSFGFSLDEIGKLLALRPESPRSCNRVLAMLEEKLGQLGRHIAEMQRFYEQLSRYRRRCRAALAEGECCPLILDVAHPR